MLHRFSLFSFMIGILVPTLINPHSVVAYPQTQPLISTVTNALTCPFPAETWSEIHELTNEEKISAFSDVFASNSSYQDYNFLLSTSNTPRPSELYPVLVKSIAGIESGWDQYLDNGQTQVSPTNDYGMLQINSGCPNNPKTALFSKTPSLRSSTRGNIAAGAELLAGKWNNGVDGSDPVVNDKDAGRLINWYYALSSYNTGRDQNSWPNDPSCDGVYSFCQGYDYTASRPWETDPTQRNRIVNARTLAPGNFPYQERVLYNLQYPSRPNTALWDVSGLGLKLETSAGDYGIRPDDALFLSPQNTPRLPNLLLFRQRYELIGATSTTPILKFEFDLPATSAITIELLDSAVDGNVLTTFLSGKREPLGWTTEFFISPRLLLPGYAYRIRATSGNSNDAVNFYEGQYVQKLNIPTDIEPPPTTASVYARANTFLPLVTRPLPPTVDINLLLNGSFANLLTEKQPDYWDIQGIFGPGILATQKLKVENQTMQFLAAPLGRAEISQRVNITEADLYRLEYDIEAQNVQSGARLEVRTRNTSGSVSWIGREAYISSKAKKSIIQDIFFDRPQIISFVANFSNNDFSSAFAISNVRLRPCRGTCTSTVEASSTQNEPHLRSSTNSSAPQTLDNESYPAPITPIPTLTPTPTINPYPSPATPTPSYSALQLDGTVDTSVLTVTLPGRFQLLFDATHAWQPSVWYDLATVPSLNLVRSDGPTRNYNVLQAPLELAYDQWYNIENAIDPTITIQENNASRVVLVTSWRWQAADGSTFAVSATHIFLANGTWQVRTVLTNTSNAARTFGGLEYAFTNVRPDVNWQETLATDSSNFSEVRSDGSTPYPTFTVRRSAPVGNFDSDGLNNRYWSLIGVHLNQNESLELDWTNYLLPGA